MSSKSRVQGPKSAAGVAGRRWFTAPRGRPRRENCESGAASHRPPAFTLIEIMVVVAIMAIVMSMSVPIVYKAWRKAPMRQAVKDVVEICSHARARAIMQGVMTEVDIYPKENRLALAGGGSPPRSAGEGASAPDLSAPAASGSGLSVQLSDRIIIETLDINMSGVEYNDVDVARIHFYPNGISDEMKMILFDGKDRFGVELEITTGLANVVRDPLREWARR